MAGLGAFQGTYSDFRLVKGRKVAQIVVEVPIEAADHALEVLGGVPRPDAERHVAVARLQIPPGATTEAAIGSAAADHPPPPERSAAPGGAKRERTLPEKVGMLCNDKSFQAWALEYAVGQGWSVGEAPADCSGANREKVVTAIVRKACGVTSRKQILPGTEAAFKWNGIVCEFEAATNRMAEERRR